MFIRGSVAAAVAAAVFAFAGNASADALPPDAEDCQTRAIGDACHLETTGAAGTCVANSCSHENESCYMAAVDAGTDAAACETSSPCNLCVAGTGGTTDGGTTTTDGGTTTTPTSTSKSGCAVGPMSGVDIARAAAPFALAALVPIFLRRRNGKKKKDLTKSV